MINLESKGIVAVSAYDGKVVDSRVDAGVKPLIPSSLSIIECSYLNPRVIYTSQLIPPELPIGRKIGFASTKIRETEAKSIAQREVTKNLSLQHRYHVGSRIRERILKPRIKDVEVTGCILYNIPFLRYQLSYKNKAYSRMIQAVTGRVWQDETLQCSICRKKSLIICEECVSTACKDHSKQCTVCGKNLCNNCAVSIGLIFRKYYCKEHIPPK